MNLALFPVRFAVFTLIVEDFGGKRLYLDSVMRNFEAKSLFGNK
jgi:hypothetical protein